ncbi:MAG TPA: MFS transporter, partial [Terriglobales bacterium]|nr:MFS transporter [Terriglobales bacterium]
MLSADLKTPTLGLTSYWRLLRHNTNFRYLWLAQIVSEIGDWFYTLALFSLLLQLTGRAESVGLALMVQVLPQTLVGPMAGVINDRLRRRSVMIVADVVRFVIVLSMLLVRSAATTWLIYPLLLLETASAAFFAPARSAVIPNIVSEEEIIVANTLSASTWSFNLMIGAALGGIVAALWGRDVVFILNAFSFLMSAFFISRTHFTEPHAEASPPLRPRDLVDFSPVMEGIRYVRKDRGLLATVFAKAGELMVGPGWVLFTVMGHRYFPVHWRSNDPERATMLGMSFLIGARGIGTLFGPLLSARWAGHSQRRLQQGIFFGYIIIAIG